MNDVDIYWANSAIKLLDTRDRYTRSSILEVFGRNPRIEALQYDTDAFITPVSNRRYSVVWRLDKDRNCALVRAVIPWINLESEPPDTRKDRVERAIARETKSAVAS